MYLRVWFVCTTDQLEAALDLFPDPPVPTPAGVVTVSSLADTKPTASPLHADPATNTLTISALSGAMMPRCHDESFLDESCTAPWHRGP